MPTLAAKRGGSVRTTALLAVLLATAAGCDPSEPIEDRRDAGPVDGRRDAGPDATRDADAPHDAGPDTAIEPPPFRPADIDGLALHFDADDAESLTASPDGRVSVWRDLSGHDNHAYQAIDRLMPLAEGGGPAGRGVLHFDRSYLTTSELIQLRATDRGYTIFAVAMNTAEEGVSGDAGRGGILLGNYRRPHSSFAVELHHDLRLRHWWDRRETFDDPADGNRGDAIFDSPRPASGAFALLTFYLDTDTGTVGAAVDGEHASPLPDDGFVYEVERPLRIGADHREQNLPTAWKGAIGELLVYDRLLGDSEMLDVHGYLSLRWQLPLRD